MKNKFYLKEFQFFDGEDTVVFNIIAVDGDKITVVVSKCGKISVSDYDLHTDKNGLYFEYCVFYLFIIFFNFSIARFFRLCTATCEIPYFAESSRSVFSSKYKA